MNEWLNQFFKEIEKKMKAGEKLQIEPIELYGPFDRH